MSSKLVARATRTIAVATLISVTDAVWWKNSNVLGHYARAQVAVLIGTLALLAVFAGLYSLRRHEKKSSCVS